MRSHPACCPAQEYPAPRHRGKQQSERDTAPGTYLGCLHSSLHFSEKGQQRMCRKHSPWRLLECAGADTRPLAALSYQSPPPQPSIQVSGNCSAPTAPRRQTAQNLRLPKTSLASFCRDRLSAVSKKKVYRLPEPGKKGFRAGGWWPGGLQ